MAVLGCGERADQNGEGGGSVGPGNRVVQDFILPTRYALSTHTFELTDPFPHLRFDDATQVVEAGGRLYVAERTGRVYSFEPTATAREKTLVLDLSRHTVADRDTGLLAIAFHPDFGRAGAEHRGDFFAYYAYSDEPAEEYESSRFPHYLRLSRFTIPDGKQGADPSSERVLISLLDRSTMHQGGGLVFNPTDGFLYLANGDEGGFDCTHKRCQRNDVLFSGVLRLDVDMRGGEISHPIRNQPQDGVTDHYYIPNDNPFVDEPGAMEELYAIGLRNPFRMTYDPVDRQIWIGDVGQQQMDEIDVLKPGANFQWDVLEGVVPAENVSDPTAPRLGVWTDPAHAYERSEMRTIVMGPVYRGSALPSLYGKLLHADFVRGKIFAADYAVDRGQTLITNTEVILETDLYDADGGPTSIIEASDGSVYLTSFGAERPLLRLAGAPVITNDAPTQLSETRLFRDLASLEPAGRMVEYEVITPLWSDGSRKRRFVAIPENTTARYKEHGAWDLPKGTVLVKHFALALDEREPDALRKLETRVLLVEDDHVYGATYRWRDDQRDADLVLEHLEDSFSIIGADGETRTQTHIYPSPMECLRCHHQGVGESLGLNTAQLNRDVEGVNQLVALDALELVSGLPDPLDAAVLDRLPRHVAIDDANAEPEMRVRSYLDANCSFCHGSSTLEGARWDARIATPLGEAGIIDAPLLDTSRDDSLRIIMPGHPERSQIFLRAGSTARDTRMPPLGSARPDSAFMDLLEDWIRSLESNDSD